MSTPRMSSLACCVQIKKKGIEPILQLTARDYNRLAIQSEALGASALGVHNLLCLTGDAPTAGRQPSAGIPFDMDASQMLWIIRRLRDERKFLDGRKIKYPPQLFLGSAGSPNSSNTSHEAQRLEKKINAGAQFIQTQLVYDVDSLEQWLEALDDRGLIEKVHVLVGIGPLRSLKILHFMQEHIPDVTIPSRIRKRMEVSSNPEETGFEITLEIIDQVRALPGVSGIHIMSLGWETILPRLVKSVDVVGGRKNH